MTSIFTRENPFRFGIDACHKIKMGLLKKYNFVIANGVKQSLFEIAKSALSPVLRLLQDFVLRNDIRVILFEKETFSAIST